MNANAKLWVEALRSGRYKQARGALDYGEEGQCCLGVACLLAIEAGVPLLRQEAEQGLRGKYAYGAEYASGVLPKAVVAWLGLQSPTAAYNVGLPSRYFALSYDNDKGKTFAEIADIIESEPEGLFVTSPTGSQGRLREGHGETVDE